MKRIHSSASSDGFYGKLKGCRASEISTLIECNKFVFESIEDADEIESNVIFTERAISRCNELYATENGPVIVFGNNEVQGLGLPMQVKGKNSDSDSDSAPDSAAVPPTILTNVNRVRSIAAGGQHFAALTVDGDVYTWGCPDEGQLGYMPSPESESVPEKVPGLNNILQVQAGNAHTLLLNTKGQVFMCGMFLSSDDTERYHFPVDGESCHGITTTPVPLKMPENKKAIRIATGNASNFAAVLLEDGQLVTFGLGEEGQLARNQDMVGRRNSMADNEIMQTFLTPQPARFKGPIPYPYPQKDVLSVACGSMHLLVLARNRGEPTVTLYSSGQNGSGQLGLPVEVQDVHELTRVRDNVGLIAAGAAHSYLVDAGGHRMYGCGENSRAELGLGHWNSPQFCWQPISFPGPILLTKIASGGGHGMALDIDNSLFTWGFGEEGQTGHVCDASGFPGGDLLRPTKLDLNSNKTILDFAGGEKSSAVVVSENDYEE